MANPTEYSNNIDKLRLKLDYEKYDNETYKGYGETHANIDVAEKTNQPGQISLPKLNYNNLVEDNFSIVDEEAAIEEESDNDDYENKGGSKKVENAMKKTAEISDSSSGGDGGKFGSIGGKGGGVMDNLGGIMNFGSQQLNMFQNEAETEAESWSSLGNSVVGGASVGLSVGGPVGAAIGAGVGAITGVVDFLGDSSARREKAKEKYDKTISFNTAKRKQEYTMKQGQESINKLTQLRKNQLGYINTEY